MSGWSPEALQHANAGKGVVRREITIFPDLPPLTVLVGDVNALVTYHTLHNDPVLDAALAADPPTAEEQATEAPPELARLRDRLATNLQAYDRVFALSIVDPPYRAMRQLPADGGLPPDALCIYSFDWPQREALFAAIRGDTADAESFRAAPPQADQPAPDREGVRLPAVESGDAGRAGAASAAVRRRGALSGGAVGEPPAASRAHGHTSAA